MFRLLGPTPESKLHALNSRVVKNQEFFYPDRIKELQPKEKPISAEPNEFL